jgi:hypothetical protein
MKVTRKIGTIVLGLIVLATVFAVNANAECGNLKGLKLQPQAWDSVSNPASLLLIHDQEASDPIVGMWHVVFTAKGNGPDGPPDGTPIDNAIVVWHRDGTEIMNSGRPPQDGNFCMGVWENDGRSGYKLNHFALGNDTENAPSGIGNPAGPTRIVENVFLDRDCNSYSGTFTLNAYDTTGGLEAHIVGVIKAVRITVNTPVSSFF